MLLLWDEEKPGKERGCPYPVHHFRFFFGRPPITWKPPEAVPARRRPTGPSVFRTVWGSEFLSRDGLARTVPDVRHVHNVVLVVDSEQDAVVAEHQVAQPDAKPRLLRSVSTPMRKGCESLYRLEELSNPARGRDRGLARDVVVDIFNVPQCPWRQARPVEGTSLGIVA